MVNNIGATYPANPIFHSRTKRLSIDYHFVHELVASGALHVSHIPSSSQLADLLTKPFPRSRHSLLTSKIGIVPPPS
ncbi:hypothetical protein L6164_033414 [Bauhinia variegata]|uniref:Uncharacterized protein n=1 Tax=Bauhinia variegata TaxID=167791 RepID=A0ACB9KRL6_BAUVA|nr:hypothetical protein L6164_033414 [Bauhinia variegata]